jgi:hypothetical protein
LMAERDWSADRRTIEAATPGKWEASGRFVGVDVSCRKGCDDHMDRVNIECDEEADARFAAEAREGWPAALDDRDRLLARVALLEGLLRPFAEYAAAVPDGWQDDTGNSLLFVQSDGSMKHNPSVKLGDCRKAWEALNAT